MHTIHDIVPIDRASIVETVGFCVFCRLHERELDVGNSGKFEEGLVI